MRVIVDYRPALRARTGAGVYMHELVRAFTTRHRDEVAVFSSSWRDRVRPDVGEALHARVIDRRVPVQVLNYLWHRWQWPHVEALAGPADVVHAAHPLMIPTKRAARVVTIHDLYFLDQPQDTQAEIRRDYPALARLHAHEADVVVTSSGHTRDRIVNAFDLDPARIHVVRPGAPNRPAPPRSGLGGHVLFLGTVERRKNLDVVLDAYDALLARRVHVPRLVVVGREGPGGRAALDRLSRDPLRAITEYRGYVTDAERETLLASARLLVLPSWDEGFGLPVLEAMSAGVPVVVSDRGSLPEVAGDAGVVLAPDQAHAWADAIERLARDDGWARRQAENGRERARQFSWDEAATALRRAYESAIARRRERA
jgi:glycosyltransferase involved in cell wall biosynthesis